MKNRIIITLLSLTIDLLFGDPPNRLHPLLVMGRWLKWGQKISPAKQRFLFGAGWVLAGTALFSLPWRLITQSGFITPFIGALLLKPVFAYRNLRQAVQAVGQALAQNDLPAARRLTGWHLVSRDTSELTPPEVAGAAIESLAENITDSVTAPLFAYAAGGLPAAWAYRFVNTADAMWGYRTPEFEQLGKFPACLDDVLNWLPARITGWLLVLASWLVGADAIRARRTMLTQHHTTPSPNAGWTMSAMAGALGIVLSKRNTYNLVGGPYRPDAWAIQRAVRIADVCVGLIILSTIMISRIFVSNRSYAVGRCQALSRDICGKIQDVSALISAK